MTNEEKKHIEDIINTHRFYPPEYKGRRDPKIITTMNSKYRYDYDNQTITRYEGRINDNGDFELVGVFTFPVGKPEEKVPTEYYNLDDIKKSFSKLMSRLGYEYDLINWNIRDLVAEAEYIRSTYYEKGHVNNDMRYENYKEWNKRVNCLRRFIRVYKPKIDGVTAYKKHNSKYD